MLHPVNNFCYLKYASAVKCCLFPYFYELIFVFKVIIILKNIFRDTISVLTKRERQKFFLLMLFNLFISIADILSLAFLFVVVNFYTPQHSLMNLSFLSQWGIKEHSLLPAVLLIIIFICKSFGGYYIYKAQYKFVYHVASRISGRNLLLYLEGSYEDHVQIDSSVLVRKICHQPIEFANYVLAGIQLMATEAILILLTVTALLIINAKLLAILSLVLLPAIAILRFVAKRRLSVVRKNAKAASEKTLQYLNEALSGFIESNIYDKNEFFAHRYTSFQSVMNTYLADLQITQGMPSRFFEVFAVFGLFVLIIASELTGAMKITDLFTLWSLCCGSL